jgi:signal transduction histidine kinase
MPSKQQFLKTKVFWYPASIFAVLGLVTVAAALGVFDSTEFLPHATCYLRNPRIIGLHVASDLAIGLSYLSISLSLGYLVNRTRQFIPFQWVFLCFGIFIISCGFTHLIEVVTVWRPLYWLAGWVKAVTAVASLGTAVGLIYILPRILEFMKAAQAAEKRRRDLTAANEELNAFAYSVSHDLRAPLRAVQGMSAALKEDFNDSLDPGAKEYLERIIGASARMDTLISDLLQYSRVSRTEVEMLPVDLGEVVEEARLAVASSISESGAKVDISLPPMKVMAHKILLVQVFANLLGNALKFVPQGRSPEVRVTAESLNKTARISVADNGIGIAPEYQEKIWRIFERLHSAAEYPGTGIGLAIVQRAVSRMNGRIGLESTPGKGSTFWIELPLG